MVTTEEVSEATERRLRAVDQGGKLAGWLRGILQNNLIDAARALGRGKRDVARERSLEAAVEESSARLDAWLAAEQTSPSQATVRAEDLLRMAKAVAELPESVRAANGFGSTGR